ncbi:hypothetical protein ACE6H2_011943 [Prunus campanulata]
MTRKKEPARDVPEQKHGRLGDFSEAKDCEGQRVAEEAEEGESGEGDVEGHNLKELVDKIKTRKEELAQRNPVPVLPTPAAVLATGDHAMNLNMQATMESKWGLVLWLRFCPLGINTIMRFASDAYRWWLRVGSSLCDHDSVLGSKSGDVVL